MEYPQAFLDQMRVLLGDDYNAFQHALFTQTPFRGLRVNTLKLTPQEFESISPYPLTPSPLCRDSFLLNSDARVGTHPFHHAGLFYMQEPSASAVIEALDPSPGMTVLDLCAAPGGKSTHLAARLAGSGVLISNECVASRVRPLCSNLERIGARNAIVTSAMPDVLADRLGPCFDAVVVDAPCSGEGMFRRDEEAVRQWSPEHVAGCTARQAQILADAARMVRQGGILIYSTCTLNLSENEAQVDAFLASHPDFTLEPIRAVSLPPAFGGGCLRPELSRAARLMPHTLPGEGHFLARMRRENGNAVSLPLVPGKPLSKEQSALFYAFWRSLFDIEPWFEPTVQNDTVWLSPGFLPGAIRAGVPAGRFIRGRFEPEHALFLATAAQHFQNRISFSPENPCMAAFLRGEQISAEAEKGWCAVCVSAGGREYPVGFGKASGGVVKNHYPKGLRNLQQQLVK